MLLVNKQGGGGLVNIREVVKIENDYQTNLGKKTTKYTISHLQSPTAVSGSFADLWIDTRLFVYKKKFTRVKFSTNCVIVRSWKNG